MPGGGGQTGGAVERDVAKEGGGKITNHFIRHALEGGLCILIITGHHPKAYVKGEI